MESKICVGGYEDPSRGRTLKMSNDLFTFGELSL